MVKTWQYRRLRRGNLVGVFVIARRRELDFAMGDSCASAVDFVRASTDDSG